MASDEPDPRKEPTGIESLRDGTDALAQRIARDHELTAAPPMIPPPLRDEEEPRFIEPHEAGAAMASEQHLLRSWRDSHVRDQTHVAAFVILALAGLALGIRLAI